jgi:hypothetical protein
LALEKTAAGQAHAKRQAIARTAMIFCMAFSLSLPRPFGKKYFSNIKSQKPKINLKEIIYKRVS